MAPRIKAPAKAIGDKPAADIKAGVDKKAATASAAKDKAATAKKEKAEVMKQATKSAGIKLTIPLDAPAATLDRFIKSIVTRGSKLDADLHSAACCALNHVALHNDPTLLNRLVQAVPKSGRANSVIIWALKFGNVALNEGKTKDTMPLVYLKEKPHDIPAAVAMPFWEFRNVREGGGREWLYADYISTVMRQLAKVAADPKSPEARKAKAALDAITAVNEAINTDVKPDDKPAPQWTAGMEDRRGAGGRAPTKEPVEVKPEATGTAAVH
jgi:hypothetical protein